MTVAVLVQEMSTHAVECSRYRSWFCMKQMRCRHLILIGCFLLPLVSVTAAEPAPALAISGRVLKIELRRIAPDRVECRVNLSLEFNNRGASPIIILRFDEEHSPGAVSVGGVSLARTQADSQVDRYIYDLQMWPSVNLGPKFKTLAQQLDQKSAPETLTRIVQPNQTWTWLTSISFDFFDKAVNQNLGWDDISQITEPLWLRLSCGLWPANLERASPGIGKKLQRRWRGTGQLWMNPESVHHILVSEPILLKINESKLRDSR